MNRIRWVVLAVALVMVGCGRSDKVKPEEIKVPEDTPLKQAESHLKRYAEGYTIASEAASFEYLANEVRKTDSTRGDILAKGFADLQKPGVNTQAKAKEILQELGPKMMGP